MGVGKYLVAPLVVIAATIASTAIAQEPPTKTRPVTIPAAESQKKLELEVNKSFNIKHSTWLDNVKMPKLRHGVDPFLINNVDYKRIYGVEHPAARYTEETMRAVRELASDVGGELLEEYQDIFPFIKVIEVGLESANTGLDNLTPEMQGKNYRFDPDFELNFNVHEPIKAIARFDRRIGATWHRFASVELSPERVRLSVSAPLKQLDINFGVGYSQRKRWQDNMYRTQFNYENNVRKKEGLSIVVNCNLRLGR
ncbi:hypothetical protein GOV07_05080 [Candidatus Woesearchaeota archaeon]|nr:hypothetical protein [Candidatus Woesearchaeota archaeon]